MFCLNDIDRPQISADETKEYPLAPVSGGGFSEVLRRRAQEGNRLTRATAGGGAGNNQKWMKIVPDPDTCTERKK